MTGRRRRRRVKRVSQVKKDVFPPKPPTVGDEVIEESEREPQNARLVSELEAIELANERNPHHVEFQIYEQRYARLVRELKAVELGYERNQLDFENLKKWADTLVSLAFFFDDNQEDMMYYLREAKLKLEEALRIKEDYYEAMYELGMFHFSMLIFDQSLELRGEGFMGHCREAIALFEQVKDKAPDVYKEDMLYRVRNEMSLNLEGDEVIEESEREQRYARLVSELEAIELANERNPHDVEILKKWAKTLVSLGYYHFDENQAMFYLQEAKSKLEEALGIKEDYYEAKFELGRVHYRMLVSNESLEHRYPRLVSELEAAELANEQNPHDVKNLKKWAETLVRFSVFFDGNQEKRMYYIREANSKLEEALGIQIDYEAMFELGMVHYAMMLLGQSKEDILGHSRKANVLFVQVEDRAPDVYKDDMLHHVSYQTMVKLKVPNSLEHLKDDEMDEGVGTISTYKLEMIFDALDMLFEKLGLDPDDTVSKNVLVKALHRLPIRDPNEGEKSARGK